MLTDNPERGIINSKSLPLTLFEAWILFVNDVEFSFASYDFAICTSFLDRCSDFHLYNIIRKIRLEGQLFPVENMLFVPINNASAAKIVR